LRQENNAQPKTHGYQQFEEYESLLFPGRQRQFLVYLSLYTLFDRELCTKVSEILFVFPRRSVKSGDDRWGGSGCAAGESGEPASSAGQLLDRALFDNLSMIQDNDMIRVLDH
jgi:hypothetical protein